MRREQEQPNRGRVTPEDYAALFPPEALRELRRKWKKTGRQAAKKWNAERPPAPPTEPPPPEWTKAQAEASTKWEQGRAAAAAQWEKAKQQPPPPEG